MSRLFWMAVGATAGVAATRKVSRTVDRFAPNGLADGLTGLTANLRDFADEVLASMAEREWQLRESFEQRRALEPPDNIKELPVRSPGLRRYAP
jgi:hypothetical protein